MYGLAENSPSTGRFVGANAIYKTEAFSVGAAYNTRKNELGQKSLTDAVFGASALARSRHAGRPVHRDQGRQPDRAVVDHRIADAADRRGDRRGGAERILRGREARTRALAHIGYRLPVGRAIRCTSPIRCSTTGVRRNSDVASYGAVFTYALPSAPTSTSC